MSYEQALSYLDDRASYQKTGRIESPSLDVISRFCELMGDPQHCAPVVHITGTNGKGSTAQMITRLLMASGLRVGTYTSPHLERVNERFTIDGSPISDDAFAEQIAAVSDLEMLSGIRPGYFDICTAAAFRWFADEAVDVMVIEVGLLGRWDATNVVNAQVAVITNIGLDHTEFAGPTKVDIAREKAGIIKPGSAVVCGETAPEIVEIFAHAGGASLLVRGTDFDVDSNQLALGGRLVGVRTPTTIYSDVVVPLHGRHQADNAVVAITAVETFCPTARARRDRRGNGGGHHARTLRGDGAPTVGHHRWRAQSGRRRRVRRGVLRGLRSGRSARAGGRLSERSRPRRHVVGVAGRRVRSGDLLPGTVAAGMPATDLVEAARRLGCDTVESATSVERAIDRALSEAGPDDAILVTGSLYVVGAARPHVARRLP